MKKVGFIGACDKSNLIMYVAKALECQNKRVLVVDATRLQKLKYLVPNISPTTPYLTNFEGIDFVVGIGSMKLLEQYLGNEIAKTQYDYMLVDIDTSKTIVSFDIPDFDKNYFVTAFDMYSLRRGLEILNVLQEPINLTKVIYRYEIQKSDEEYFNFLSIDYKVNWEEISIYLPNDGNDIQEIEENQKISRIRIKKLSSEYQNGIVYIAQDILQEQNKNKIKKNIKV